MRKAVAKIKLSPGNVAWYDPLTNIYLTLKSPEAFVYEGDDLTNIKKAIKYNCVQLREGSFPSQVEEKEVLIKENLKVEPKQETKSKKEIISKQETTSEIKEEKTPKTILPKETTNEAKEVANEVKTKGRGKHKKENTNKNTSKKEKDK